MVSAIGIMCNVLLAVMKLAAGVLSGMISVVADSLNNFSDSAASIVSLVGFKISSKPADDEHPFGHARYEYIAGLVVAFLVMMVGVELVKSSIEKFVSPTDIEYPPFMYVILVISIVVKCFMMIMYTTEGRKMQSTVLRAAAKDSFFDMIITGSVLAGALISMIWNVNLDAVVGLAIGLFIAWTAVGMVKETLEPLVGRTPERETVDELERMITGDERVLGAHDLMVHDYGPGHIFASAHVELPADMKLTECHDIIDGIEERVMAQSGIEIVLHADPIVSDDSETAVLRNFVSEKARSISPDIGIHELRIVPGPDGSRLLFDCRIPDTVDEVRVRRELKEAVGESYPKLRVSIRIDHGFVALNKPEDR